MADVDAALVENEFELYGALRAANGPAAMHLFEQGGHGFGFRGIAGTPREDWPGLVTRWGRDKGIFPVQTG